MLLAVLASLDALFLLLMLPNAIANFDTIAFNPDFRRVYLASKVHLMALMNQLVAKNVKI